MALPRKTRFRSGIPPCDVLTLDWSFVCLLRTGFKSVIAVQTLIINFYLINVVFLFQKLIWKLKHSTPIGRFFGWYFDFISQKIQRFDVVWKLVVGLQVLQQIYPDHAMVVSG